MKIRHFLLLVVVLMSLVGIGCAPARSEMEYLSSGGRGEVAGQMSGMAFSAVVELSANGERVQVEYLSPDALCGLTLTLLGESCEVRLGEMCFTCDRSEVADLLRPATAFLPCGEINSVQKEGENTVLTFPADGMLTLSPQGEPRALFREDIDMRVVWWQSGEKESFGS